MSSKMVFNVRMVLLAVFFAVVMIALELSNNLTDQALEVEAKVDAISSKITTIEASMKE